MERKLKALDLFCCAGGAGAGLAAAGFDVTGVDIVNRKRYPFNFILGDAMEVDLSGYDLIWASPPCQGYSAMRHAPGAVGAARLIDAVRDRMPRDTMWVIENVEGAKGEMIDPFTLCGSMFDLGAQGCRLQRHRLFEANFHVSVPDCSHDDRPVIGVYGGHARKRSAKSGGRGTKDVWEGGHRAAASEALGGVDWMTLSEMSECIPPAYAEHIGKAAIAALRPTTQGEE